jgi:uncharacterized protein (TIGR02588 family)
MQQARSSDRDGRDQTEKTDRRGRRVPEWVTLSISALLVLATLGIVIWEMLQPSVPATFEIMPAGQVRHIGDAYQLPVQVKNVGNEAAEDVRVAVELVAQGGVVERSELQFRFVGAGSTRTGVVVFSRDPARHEVRADIISYVQP